MVGRALVALAASFGFAASPAFAAQNTPPSSTPAQTAGPADPFARGEEQFRLAHYAEAESAFALACNGKDSGKPLAWAMLGRARQAQWLLAGAIEAYERADALSADDPRILQQLGECHFELQHLDQADKLFRRTLVFQPASSRAHMYLARIAVARGDDASAEREFTVAVTAPTPDPIAPFHQGLMFLRLKRLAEAQKAFERSLELNPDLPGAHMNLGLVLARLGKQAESQAHLQRFRELQELEIAERAHKIEVSSLLVQVNKDIEAGNYEAALAPALRARDIEPAWPRAHELLARIYAALDRKEESARELESARTATENAAKKREAQK